MSKLVLMVGPPGSGKSTYAKKNFPDYTYINQDSQGKGHLNLFTAAILRGEDIIIDRMNFDVQQRMRYLTPAKGVGYETEIIVLHESRDTCWSRMEVRENHETIKDAKSARSALDTFFGKYFRPSQAEADKVTFLYPETKEQCIVVDIDGTLANVDHRLHHMKGDRKNWPGFFKDMVNDTPNEWCKELVKQMRRSSAIVLCSGRPDDHEKTTREWLTKHNIEYRYLFMRLRNDSRRDDVIKENILDFEILTRFKPFFFIDDRKQVYEKWRSRGFVCLACHEGNF